MNIQSNTTKVNFIVISPPFNPEKPTELFLSFCNECKITYILCQLKKYTTNSQPENAEKFLALHHSFTIIETNI